MVDIDGELADAGEQKTQREGPRRHPQPHPYQYHPKYPEPFKRVTATTVVSELLKTDRRRSIASSGLASMHARHTCKVTISGKITSFHFGECVSLRNRSQL